jgi:hypothetical protein
MIENIVLRTAITLGDVSNEGSCWFTRCGPSVARSAVDTPPVAVHALPEVGQDKFTVCRRTPLESNRSLRAA